MHAWYLVAVLMENNDVPHWFRSIQMEATKSGKMGKVNNIKPLGGLFSL